MKLRRNWLTNFNHPEVHDLGFVVLEFREATVKLGSDVKLKTHRRRLAGLKLKSRHPHRAIHTLQAWTVRTLDLEGLRPGFAHFRVEWCDNGGEKLIRHGGPLRAIHLFLEHRLRRAFLDPDERIILRGKPTHVGRLRFALDAPDQTGV